MVQPLDVKSIRSFLSKHILVHFVQNALVAYYFTQRILFHDFKKAITVFHCLFVRVTFQHIRKYSKNRFQFKVCKQRHGKLDFWFIRRYDIIIFINCIIPNGKFCNSVKLLFGRSALFQIRACLTDINLILHLLICCFHRICPIKIQRMFFNPCAYKIDFFLRYSYFCFRILRIIGSALGNIFYSIIKCFIKIAFDFSQCRNIYVRVLQTFLQRFC